MEVCYPSTRAYGKMKLLDDLDDEYLYETIPRAISLTTCQSLFVLPTSIQEHEVYVQVLTRPFRIPIVIIFRFLQMDCAVVWFVKLIVRTCAKMGKEFDENW